MLSQLAATVGLFRSLGIRPEVSHLAFEPVILDALPPAPTEAVDISFVGTVSADHQQRVALLEAIARRYEFKLFGNIAPGVPASSPLHRCFQGEAWGADMYQALRRSLIMLNSHIDMVGREAGIARLFEATGVGTFLLTDFKDNLQALFEPSREVVAWRSVNECLSMLDRYLNDEDKRTAVAIASQDTFDAYVPATRGRHPAIRRQKLGWLRSNDRFSVRP
jgi:hypothetical protein